jgi:hypothetical protein
VVEESGANEAGAQASGMADTAKPPPSPPEEPPMEIHKPKPVHSWRELLGEIGVIVIGVLIALGAEQAVDWLHWKSELAETREALNQELTHTLGSFQYRITLQGCINHRLDDLSHWLATSQPGDKLPLARTIGQPQGYAILTGTWETAKGGQAAWRMPLRERLLYAHLYASLDRFTEVYKADNDIWRQLAEFDGAEPLDHADRMRLRGLISQGRTFAKLVPSFPAFIMPDVVSLGITPEKRPVVDAQGLRSFCAPLLVPKAN